MLNETEKIEVHRLVLEMMKAVAITEANSGVLNLKTRRPSVNEGEHHPFREYMDNTQGGDTSVSDSEEIMAYVNMKVKILSCLTAYDISN